MLLVAYLDRLAGRDEVLRQIAEQAGMEVFAVNDSWGSARITAATGSLLLSAARVDGRALPRLCPHAPFLGRARAVVGDS
jgi:hypothetical protein